jgi:hypothetical protein
MFIPLALTLKMEAACYTEVFISTYYTVTGVTTLLHSYPEDGGSMFLKMLVS